MSRSVVGVRPSSDPIFFEKVFKYQEAASNHQLG